jgi:hypothetical protein
MTVISLQDKKYEIERDENGLMVGMWRNGEFWKSGLELFAHAQVFHAALDEIERLSKQKPIDMILHCPNCGEQHIDAPKVYQCQHPTCGCAMTDGPPCQAEHNSWENPPHRSHLCHACGHIWRPADVPTNGVAEIKTKGTNDSPEPNFAVENEAQGYALEAIHQFVPELRIREDGQTLLTPAQVETILRRMGWKPPGEQRHGQ